MKLKYRPFTAIGFTILLSLFLIIYIGNDFAPVFIAVGVLGMIISLMFKSVRERLVPLYLAGSLVLSGIAYYSAGYEPESVKKYIGENVKINGVVTDSPSFSNSRYYYVIDLNEIDGNPVESKIRLSLPSELTCEVFDVVTLDVKIYEIASESDRVKLYYYSKGIFIGGYNYNTDDFDVIVEKGNPDYFSEFVYKAKNYIIGNIRSNIPGEAGATVNAMLLGDKSDLSDERTESFRQAGIAPIFAVSGLHLSIWVLGLFSILKSLGLKKRINSLISILFTLFFMFLTGFTPSVCRSGIMMIMLLIGNLFYRKADSLNSLGFVATFLCLLNPYIAVDTGFLLSFFATFGIVTLVPLCNKYALEKLPKNLIGTLVKKVAMPFIVSLSASVTVLPFTIILIGEVSVLSVISNVLLSYLASVCMVTGGIAALIAYIPFVSDFFFAVAALLSKILLWFVDYICTSPVTVVSTENLFWKLGAFAAVVVVIFCLFNFSGKNTFKAICVGLAGNILIFSLSAYFYFDNLTQIRILNVGNGISVVAYCNGEKIVLTGKADSYTKKYQIDEALSLYDRDNLDLLLLADNNALNDSSNFSLLLDDDFERVVLPYSNQSLESVIDSDKIYTHSAVNIEVFEGDSVRFNICEKYSLALCNFDNVTVLFIFDSFKKAEISDKYLEADYLVCNGYIPSCITPEKYKKVFVCGEEERALPVIDYVTSCGGVAQPLYELDSVLINIKDESAKIILLED